MAEFDVDLFVIGGGSGGVRAARIAAGYGAKVMVAEEYRMGGTCVIRGCVPKKLFVLGSHVHQEIEDAAGFGWTIPTPTFDWPTLIKNKDKEIARLEAAYTTNVARVKLADDFSAVLQRGSWWLASRSSNLWSCSRLLASSGARNSASTRFTIERSRTSCRLPSEVRLTV